MFLRTYVLLTQTLTENECSIKLIYDRLILLIRKIALVVTTSACEVSFLKKKREQKKIEKK